MTTPHQPSSFRPTADGSPAPAQQPMWRLERATHGRLDLIDAAGQRHVDVDVLRAVPASAPAGPVAVVAADGAELAWIDPWSDLDEPLRGALAAGVSAGDRTDRVGIGRRADGVGRGDRSRTAPVHRGTYRRHRLRTRRKCLHHRQRGRAVRNSPTVAARFPQSAIARPAGLNTRKTRHPGDFRLATSGRWSVRGCPYPGSRRWRQAKAGCP